MPAPIRLAAALALAALPLFSTAATSESDALAERHADAQRCMRRTMGEHWAERYGVKLARNQWGVEEATAESVDSAPQVIRITYLRCRRETGIDGAPRP